MMMRIAVGALHSVSLEAGAKFRTMSGDELNMRVDALTSQTRRFRSLIGEFLRLEFKRDRSPGRVYEVCIRIERPGTSADPEGDHVADQHPARNRPAAGRAAAARARRRLTPIGAG